MADGIIAITTPGKRFRTSATSGETFAIIKATKPNGTTWSGGPTITHLGSGTFEATFTPDVEGVWNATWIGNTSGALFSESWDIIPPVTPIYTRKITGGVISKTDINELQQDLEKTLRVLRLA